MKKYLSLLVMLMMSIAMSAEVISGSCGTHVTYTFDTETGIMKIEGTGAMSNYNFTSKNGKYTNTSPWYLYLSDITTLIVSEGVTNIGNYAFYGSHSLVSVLIPSSVTNIGNNAFLGCSSLTTVSFPNGLTSIGESAFQSCSSLASVTIPESLTSIKSMAFSGCKLENINIIDLAAWCQIDGLSCLLSYGVSNKTILINGEEIRDLVIPFGVTKIASNCF